MAPRYVLYGDLRDRRTAILASVLVAKRLGVDFVDQTPSLTLALAARAGRGDGPFLRTPEGFVLADVRVLLEWLERTHPEPALLPAPPIRRVAARLLEDWIDLWLPHWPRRSWGTLERLAAHLERAGFLLGRCPVRADWMLAAWLETEVLVHADARRHVERRLPMLRSIGERLLDGAGRADDPSDDALPISLLEVLHELGRDYGAYLERNHAALKDGEQRVELDLGLGHVALPVQVESERGRIVIGRELASLERATRRRVAGVYETLRVWHALTLPPAIEEIDPGDPRSL
jgi:glutathione S-transferase